MHIPNNLYIRYSIFASILAVIILIQAPPVEAGHSNSPIMPIYLQNLPIVFMETEELNKSLLVQNQSDLATTNEINRTPEDIPGEYDTIAPQWFADLLNSLDESQIKTIPLDIVTGSDDRDLDWYNEIWDKLRPELLDIVVRRGNEPDPKSPYPATSPYLRDPDRDTQSDLPNIAFSTARFIVLWVEKCGAPPEEEFDDTSCRKAGLAFQRSALAVCSAATNNEQFVRGICENFGRYTSEN